MKIGTLWITRPHQGKGLCIQWSARRQPGDGPFHYRVHFIRLYLQ